MNTDTQKQSFKRSGKSKKFIASAAATGGLVTSLILSKPTSTLAADTYADKTYYSVDVYDSLDNENYAEFEDSLYAQGLSPSQVHAVINSVPSDTKMKSFKKGK